MGRQQNMGFNNTLLSYLRRCPMVYDQHFFATYGRPTIDLGKHVTLEKCYSQESCGQGQE